MFLCAVLKSLSRIQLFVTPWTVAHQAPLSMGILQARIPGVGCHALLQGIIATQGSNPGLPHCRQLLYHLSHHLFKVYFLINPRQPFYLMDSEVSYLLLRSYVDLCTLKSYCYSFLSNNLYRIQGGLCISPKYHFKIHTYQHHLVLEMGH